MVTPAVFWATIGGSLWGCSSLGKRFGTAKATAQDKAASAAATAVAEGLGKFTFTAVSFCLLRPAERAATWSDVRWTSKLPLIVSAGFANGLGSVLSTISFSLADHNLSSWIAVVQNGLYSVTASLLLILCFNERLTWLQWLSLVIVIVGIFIVDASRLAVTVGTEADKCPEAPESTGAAYGSVEEITTESSSEAGCQRLATNLGISAGQAAFYIALVSALLWPLGTLGKKYGVDGSSEEQMTSRSTCTYFVYSAGNLVPAILNAVGSAAASKARWAGVCTEWLLRRAPFVFVAGVLDSTGGLLCVYALAVARPGSSALIAMVENGVFTVSGSMLIVLAYREEPGKWQILSAALILLAVILADSA